MVEPEAIPSEHRTVEDRLGDDGLPCQDRGGPVGGRDPRSSRQCDEIGIEIAKGDEPAVRVQLHGGQHGEVAVEHLGDVLLGQPAHLLDDVVERDHETVPGGAVGHVDGERPGDRRSSGTDDLMDDDAARRTPVERAERQFPGHARRMVPFTRQDGRGRQLDQRVRRVGRAVVVDLDHTRVRSVPTGAPGRDDPRQQDAQRGPPHG